MENPTETPNQDGVTTAAPQQPLTEVSRGASATMHMKHALGWLIALIAVLAAIYYAFLSDQLLSRPGGQTNEQVSQISTDMLKGDFSAAARVSEQVITDDKNSAEVKARALAFALSAEYRATGDANAMIDEIRLMKQYISDSTVSTDTRARLINALAAQYQISGGSKAVFDAMFEGAPFDSFKATGGRNSDLDARVSVRRLLEWSYATMPTAYAAIGIARWYSEQALFTPDMPEEEVRQNAALAEDFLRKAEAADRSEAQRIANYQDTVVLLYYRHWRAIIYGRLATQIGEPYASRYKKEYEDVLAFQDAHSNPMAREFALYTRVFYASKLRAAGQTDAATVQLDELARRMNSIDTDGVNAFFSFIRIEYAERPNGATYRNLFSSNFAISPDFEAAVMRVISER